MLLAKAFFCPNCRSNNCSPFINTYRKHHLAFFFKGMFSSSLYRKKLYGVNKTISTKLPNVFMRKSRDPRGPPALRGNFLRHPRRSRSLAHIQVFLSGSVIINKAASVYFIIIASDINRRLLNFHRLI